MTTEYIPDLFLKLSDFLQDLIDKPDPSLLPRLRLELDRARPFALNLFHKRPRNPKEADQIRKGGVTFLFPSTSLYRSPSLTMSNGFTETPSLQLLSYKTGQFVYQGTLHSHTPDFTHEALYLAEQLDLSENQCAILLQHGMTRKARYGRPNADNAVIIFYHERSALLRFLILIFSPTDSDDVVNSGLSEELERFRNDLVSSRSDSVKQETWISKVFKEIEQSKNQILKLKTQLTSTSTTTNNYGFQSTNNAAGNFNFGSTSATPQKVSEKSNEVVVKFSDEIVQKMLEQHQSERRELGQIVYLIGFSRLLNRGHILTLVDTLAEMNSQDPLICHFLMAFLAAMDGECTSATEAEYSYLTGLWHDVTFMKTMTERLTEKRWLVRQAKAVALLQWCLFLGSAYQYVEVSSS
jgi:nuclear pore complex protein Nup205